MRTGEHEFIRGAKDGVKRRVFRRGVQYAIGIDAKTATHEVCDLQLDGQFVKQVIRIARIERE